MMSKLLVLGGFVNLLLLTCLVTALEDGRVGVLYISDPIRVPAVDYLRTDPLFSITLVAASYRGFGGWEIADVQRAVRLYMPRNYEDLLSKYDAVTLDNANVFAVGDRYIEMIARAAREGDRGLLMTGGWESYGGYHNPAWGVTAVGEILPTTDVEGAWVEQGRMVADDLQNEFMSSLPWERRDGWRLFPHNLVTVKAGGRLLAYTEDNLWVGPQEHPLFVTWELPAGTRVFACTGELGSMHPRLDPGGMAWEYFLDLSANLLFYVSKRPVPQDVDLVHLLRETMFNVRALANMLLSYVEFVENFGANTQGIMSMIDETDELLASAMPMYLELRFEDVLEVYQDARALFTGIESEAIKLKNRVLLWVYVVEWLVVSGTMILTGGLLWSIMVRRRLYKEVRVTKFLA